MVQLLGIFVYFGATPGKLRVYSGLHSRITLMGLRITLMGTICIAEIKSGSAAYKAITQLDVLLIQLQPSSITIVELFKAMNKDVIFTHFVIYFHIYNKTKKQKFNLMV